MSWLWGAIASFFSGAAGSMGIGGGSILLLYLTAVAGMEQLQAQGINLLFFLPIAVLSVVIHGKNHMIRWKVALVCILVGLAGVWCGLWLIHHLDPSLLRKLFAALLLAMGCKELLSKKEPEKAPKAEKDTGKRA